MATVRLAETYEEDSLTAVIGFLQGAIDGAQVRGAGGAGEARIVALEGQGVEPRRAGARAPRPAPPQGKAFAEQANKLVDAGRFDELITLLASHVDRVTAAAPKGARRAPAGRGAARRRCARREPPLPRTGCRRAPAPAPPQRGQRGPNVAAPCRAPRAARAARHNPLGPAHRPPPTPAPRTLPLLPPKDAECCLAVMAHLVKKITGGEDAERAAAAKLAAALSAKVRAHGRARRAPPRA
jgi:hypothetical protein